jgi:sulfur-carrier protein
MKVNLYATLRHIVGAKSIELALPEGATVQYLLDDLLRQYPALRKELIDESGQLYQHVNVFVNNRQAPFLENGMDTPLPKDAVIGIFPAVGGG